MRLGTGLSTQPSLPAHCETGRSVLRPTRGPGQPEVLAMLTRLGLFFLLLLAFAMPARAQEAPGPSATLYGTPFYSCLTNYYVSSLSGASDSNDGLAASVGGGHGPWATLTHAASVNVGAGSCINGVSGSSWATGPSITHGGNASTSTGFVVWRCTALNGCTITNPGYGFQIEGAGKPRVPAPAQATS